MLELSGVSKIYDGNTALRATDLEIATGCTTVLIGPSGCGKSTLLRLMIGLVRPSTGDIRFDGQPLTTENLRAVRRRTGYVIQDGGLFPHLTARGNVTLASRHFGMSAGAATRRLEELTELVHIDPTMLDRYPRQLSGGQRQRVSLMRALMLDPDVLLLDEPLGALDPMIRAELQADLKTIFGHLHKTVVMVTHDLAEAAHFAHVIVLLADGTIVQRGSFADLRDAPATEFVTRFVNAHRALHEDGP